jgi:hypothetical protein
MRFEAAMLKYHDRNFAVVAVKPAVLANKARAAITKRGYARAFSPTPVVLMAKDAQGKPSYYGRPDLVGAVAALPSGSIRFSTHGINKPGAAYELGKGPV